MSIELDLDPFTVLRYPWLWDEETVQWAKQKCSEVEAAEYENSKPPEKKP